jgi:hypothetical protein
MLTKEQLETRGWSTWAADAAVSRRSFQVSGRTTGQIALRPVRLPKGYLPDDGAASQERETLRSA